MTEHVLTTAKVLGADGEKYTATVECPAELYDGFPEMAVTQLRAAVDTVTLQLASLGVPFDQDAVIVTVERVQRDEETK